MKYKATGVLWAGLYSSVFFVVNAVNCPGNLEFTLSPGQSCMVTEFSIDGKSIKDIPWSGSGPRPGHDCQEAGSNSYIYSVNDQEECRYSVTIKGVCSWYPNPCWPGDCSGGWSANCNCRNGFRTDSAYRSGKICQPYYILPNLSTCRVGVIDRGNSNTDSPTTGSLTNCANQQSIGIKTQPTVMTFAIKADLTHTMGNLTRYVSESKFGVIGATINITKVSLTGAETILVTKELNTDRMCQRNVNSLSPVYGQDVHDCHGNITLPSVGLHDGFSLCADITAFAGGYYKLQDDHGNYYATTTFTPTKTWPKRICFHYDETKPAHCLESQPYACVEQPLALASRLTRSRFVRARIEGWSDPRPPGGENNPLAASGLREFRLEVHGVDIGNTAMSVQDNARNELTKAWNASSQTFYDVIMTLPEENATRLYALILEVHDKAGNVRYARRLVLYDRTSRVQFFSRSSLKIVHANPRSLSLWQTDVSQQLCVNWTGRFYNTEMLNNDFLKAVKPDTGREISGHYDQISGSLPIAGTDHVNGIVKFETSWSVNKGNRSAYMAVADVFIQKTCVNRSLLDGETYDVFVKATDIMNNTLEDSVRVSIDHTGPEVSVRGLRGRWGTEGLYVHNSTDLSTMRLVLTAQDPHSGLSSIHWTLGTRPLLSDVGSAAVAVKRLPNMTSCGTQNNCYCPSVGDCEIFNYEVTFPNLVHLNTHQGDHHRDYYITINVTNVASLPTVATLDLLLDETPPIVGVVWEGLSLDGQAEMDFTSSPVVTARWHGFEDHESSLMLYRVVLANRCMTTMEMDATPNATVVQHPETMASFVFPQEGCFYVSVVGYNGALEPSQVACSDGITYDTTPPAFFNVSIKHARSGHMVGCTQQEKAWLVNSNLTRVALSDVTGCRQQCSNASSSQDVSHLPLSSTHTLDSQLSAYQCQKMPRFNEDSYIVLPSDDVRVTWMGYDAESDMEEYYIGMGGDRTASSAPTLLTFTPTHGHPSYNAHHVGLSHGDVFFIFLQALNKAGLSSDLIIGPVLIDVTPPVVTQKLAAEVKSGNIQVLWSRDVFVDPEQPTTLDLEVSFRVGYNDQYLTPFMEMSEAKLSMCRHNNVMGCVQYPITALYDHDTQQGGYFFLQLHVINAAGHGTTVNTSSVLLPARYPPSQGFVIDVLKSLVPDVSRTTSARKPTPMADYSNSNYAPNSIKPSSAQNTKSSAMFSSPTTPTPSLLMQFTSDVDVILQQDEVCTTWSGFYHPETIRFEVGLGTVPHHDDVIGFLPVKNASHACFQVASAPLNTKLFSVVRATSSGGVAVFSSDGFVMVPVNTSESGLEVYNGKGCLARNTIGTITVSPLASSLSFSNFTTVTLHHGDLVFLRLRPFVASVNFSNAIVLQTSLTGYQLIALKADINLLFTSPKVSNVTVEVQVCLNDARILPVPADHVSSTWEIQSPLNQMVKYMKVEIVDRDCAQSVPSTNASVWPLCLVHQASVGGRERQLIVPAANILSGHTYFTSLQPCFDDGCLPAIFSQNVTYVTASSVAVTVDSALIYNVTADTIFVKVEASVSLYTAKRNGLRPLSCICSWAISRDEAGSVFMTEWSLYQADNCSKIMIEKYVNYTSDDKGFLYVCLQLLVPIKSETPKCLPLIRLPQANDDNPFHVVELDHDVFRLTDFEPYLHSQQLSVKLHELFDLDLDFAKSDVMLSAVLTNGMGRNVSWFLMTGRHLPEQNDCDSDADCVTHDMTSTGYVTFPRHRSHFQNSQVYFVCARTSRNTEDKNSMKDMVFACGDGVVIDDVPPTPGVVNKENAKNGFLGNTGQVLITWSDFSDVEKVVNYIPDVTLSFSVALGSAPGQEDLAGFVETGQRTSWLFANLHILSGTLLYATVRAKDRVGHVTKVSSDPLIVDSTPPSVERLAVGTLADKYFFHGNELSIHWEGLEDKESGIMAVEVAISDEGSGEDLMAFQECDNRESITFNGTNLVDGHTYVAVLKVTNRAGITTLAFSEPFVLDNSSPSPGHVWFSGLNTSTPSGYSTEVGMVNVEWAGFEDPHSGLQYYRAGLGSRPGDTDVLPFVYLGLQSAHRWRAELAQGIRYYATVQACNRAGLCRATSSGSITFDNSPPTSGHVTVGMNAEHDKFIGRNTSLPVQWAGFSDPQTGIQHFTWCVGTAPLLCDVTAASSAGLATSVHGTGLVLPTSTPLYVTVRASNPAGLQSVSVSDSFRVDSSPPEVVVTPQFMSPRDGLVAKDQCDRSVLHVTWQFLDPESSVVSHVVYVRSKLTGRLIVDALNLGAQKEIVLTLDEGSLLADGDSHWASVTACNAAHLCVTSTSDVILVDSTPPVSGTFLSPLQWSREIRTVNGDVWTLVDVMWRGFSDAESGVLRYRLLAGREYNGQELSVGRVEVAHDIATITQRYRLEITGELRSGEVYHLALLAENSLGMPSALVRAAFTCLLDNHNATSGSLVLLRHSCQSSYCTKECTCAAAGKLCDDVTEVCVELDPSRPELSQFTVLPLMGRPGSQHQQFSTSAKCLEGHWSLLHPEALVNVSRFQYSFSLANMSAGQGVVDTQTEPVWYDVGRHVTALHCLPGNRTLLSGQRYVLHVRVWPSTFSHMTFTSSPLLLDHSPPQVRRSRNVIESDLTCVNDFDYIINTTQYITACWHDVFVEAQSSVLKYELSIGTSPQGSDYTQPLDVGLNTSWVLSTAHLESGVRYYVTVRTWNQAGLQATAVSDGFMVDVTPPVTGVAFSSGSHSNVYAQSSTDRLSTSWHGFEDLQSGVRAYQVAVYNVDNLTHPVMPFTDVGIKTNVLLEKLSLHHFNRYRISVKAVDGAGLSSPVADSVPILVDVTPPEGVTCTDFGLQEEIVMSLYKPSASYLHDKYTADFEVEATNSYELVRVELWALKTLPRLALGYIEVAELRMPIHFHFTPTGGDTAQHDFMIPDTGKYTVHVVVKAPRGATIIGRLYRCNRTQVSSRHAVTIRQLSTTSLSVCARIRDAESGIKTMKVGVGTTEGGLQVVPWTLVGHTGHVTFPVHVQHASPVYVTVVSENHAGLWSRFFSLPLIFDLTPPTVSDVALTLRYQGEASDNATSVIAEALWIAEDRESGVESCSCTLEGQPTVEPAQLQLINVTEGQCKWKLYHPSHGSEVKVTITCINAIQLQRVVTSEAVRVIFNPPDVGNIFISSLSNHAVMPPYHWTTPLVRSSNSSLQFFWRGLYDPTVSAVYFRFRHQSRPLTEWFTLHPYKTTAVLDRDVSRTGEITAELKVVNERMQMSKIVLGGAVLDDSGPLLTGQSAEFSVDANEMRLDWSTVFHVTRDVTFSVYAGSGTDLGDVINHVQTSLTQWKGKRVLAVMPQQLFVGIEAVYDNGHSRVYLASFKL